MSSSATGHDPRREAADKAAADTPDPKDVNVPATGDTTRDTAGDEGISAFNVSEREAAARRASLAGDETTPAPAQAPTAPDPTATGTAPAGTTGVPAAGVVTPAATTESGAGAESVPMHAMTLGMAVTSAPGRFFFALARILLGWVFLWAFIDKLFGLGRSTSSDASWINGGSPTTGYLNGVDGPFASFFNSMAGQAWADWLFMIGLAGIGLALILGIGMWLAAITGTVLLVGMWMASLPLTENPFLDEHLLYAVVLIGLAFVRGGDTLGLGKPWARSGLVRAVPFLR